MTRFVIERASARGFKPCKTATQGDLGLAWDGTMNKGWFVDIESFADLEALAKETGHRLLVDFGSTTMNPSITIADDYLE